jgi:hypothetical protein
MTALDRLPRHLPGFRGYRITMWACLRRRKGVFYRIDDFVMLMLDEFPPNRAQHTFFGDTLDCRYLLSIRLDGEYQTGLHWDVIKQYSASGRSGTDRDESGRSQRRFSSSSHR